MYRWICILNTLQTASHYINELGSLSNRKVAEARKIRLHFYLLFLLVLHAFYLMQTPLPKFERFLHFDFTLFFECSQKINFNLATMCAQMMHMLYSMYSFDFKRNGKSPQSLRKLLPTLAPKFLVRKVYFYKDDKSFLYRRDAKTNLPISEMLHKYFKMFLYFLDYLNYLIVILDLYYLAAVLHYYSLDWRYYFTVIPDGWLCVLLVTLNHAHFIVYVNSDVTLNCVFFLINYIFTKIIFIRLAQGNRVLQTTGSTHRFGQFMRYHTETLKLILVNNGSFGGAILVLIFACIFTNSYVTNLIIAGKFNLVATIFFVNIVFFQWVAIGGFHLMAAFYNKRIHSCSKLLLHKSATKGLKKADLSNALKLDNYVAKFHTANRYGITYSRYGLITIQSFIKFLFIYIKIFMFWCKLRRS